MSESSSTRPSYHLMKDGIVLPSWAAYHVGSVTDSGLLFSFIVGFFLLLAADLMTFVLLCGLFSIAILALVSCTDFQLKFPRNPLNPEPWQWAVALLMCLANAISAIIFVLTLAFGVYQVPDFTIVTKFLLCTFVNIIALVQFEEAWDRKALAESSRLALNPTVEVEVPSLEDAEEFRGEPISVEEMEDKDLHGEESDEDDYHSDFAGDQVVTPTCERTESSPPALSAADEAEATERVPRVPDLEIQVARLTVQNIHLASRMASMQDEINSLTSNLALLLPLRAAESYEEEGEEGYEQPYGQQYQREYELHHEQPYERPYEREYEQGYGQPYEQDYDQAYLQPHGQAYGQDPWAYQPLRR